MANVQPIFITIGILVLLGAMVGLTVAEDCACVGTGEDEQQSKWALVGEPVGCYIEDGRRRRALVSSCPADSGLNTACCNCCCGSGLNDFRVGGTFSEGALNNNCVEPSPTPGAHGGD